MDRLAIIIREADRLAQVLSDTSATARVPTCPDWNAEDLLWHLTEVHLIWSGILHHHALSDDQAEEVEESLPARPDTLTDLLKLREEATATLVEELSTHDDDQPRWTWFPPEQTVGFTRRMQTYEATMHRIDAELTAGLTAEPLTAEVATGAVEHCVDVMWWGGMPAWAHYTPAAVIQLHATDTGDHWLVEAGRWGGIGPQSGQSFDEPRAVRATSGSAAAVFSGQSHQLALWAWGRGGELAITGDPEAITAMRDVVGQGIQ